MSRKYTPPIRIRPEPRTRKEIVEEIAELQAHSKGSERYLADWINRRIKELQERLEGLK
jgi:transcription elongation GreA/GreB family factor